MIYVLNILAGLFMFISSIMVGVLGDLHSQSAAAPISVINTSIGAASNVSQVTNPPAREPILYSWVSLEAAPSPPVYVERNGSIYNSGDDYLVSGADLNSFEVWSDPGSAGSFARDKNHVYVYGRVLAGADPTSLRFLYDSQGDFTGYFLDKNNVYYFFYADGANRLDDADRSTFSTMPETETCGPGCDYDATDKNHKFYLGEVVNE
jgi:DKNYY family